MLRMELQAIATHTDPAFQVIHSHLTHPDTCMLIAHNCNTFLAWHIISTAIAQIKGTAEVAQVD